MLIWFETQMQCKSNSVDAEESRDINSRAIKNNRPKALNQATYGAPAVRRQIEQRQVDNVAWRDRIDTNETSSSLSKIEL